MKKAILLCIVLISLFMFSGCRAVIIDESGIKHETQYGFVVIKKHDDDGVSEICYDPSTRICYIVLAYNYRAAISPYYIINNNGEPELAVYGVNYFGL